MPRKMVLRLDDGSTPILTESLADNELQLQELIKEHPDLIPVEEFGISDSLMVVGRETVLPSGAVDLVGVTRGGEILIIEFKTGPQNSDFRHALAQLLDYGADMWGMSFEQFESTVARRYFASDRCRDSRLKGKSSLVEASKTIWPDVTDEEVESFREQIESRLAKGAFEYVLVAQRFTEPILKTVEYLNATMQTSRFYAVELVKFDADVLSAFESRTVVKPTIQSKSSSPVRVGESEILQNIENEDYRTAIEQIFEVCHGLRLNFYRGTAGVSVGVITPSPSRKTISIAWWFPPGRVGWMNLTDLTLGFAPWQDPIKNSPELLPIMNDYLEKINTIGAVEPEGRGGIQAYRLNPETVVKSQNQITEIIAEVVKNIRSAG